MISLIPVVGRSIHELNQSVVAQLANQYGSRYRRRTDDFCSVETNVHLRSNAHLTLFVPRYPHQQQQMTMILELDHIPMLVL